MAIDKIHVVTQRYLHKDIYTKNINQCKFLEKCLLYVQFFYQLQYPPLKGIENQFLCRH